MECAEASVVVGSVQFKRNLDFERITCSSDYPRASLTGAEISNQSLKVAYDEIIEMRSSSMAVHWEQRTYGELDAAEQLKTFGAKLVELETHAIRHFGSEQAAEGRRRMDIKGGRPAMRAAALVLRDSGRNKSP